MSLAIVIAVNSVVFMGAAPIAPLIRDAYGLSSNFWPNLVQMLFPLLSLLLMPVAMLAYKQQQVSNTLRIAALLFAAGAWLRSGI